MTCRGRTNPVPDVGLSAAATSLTFFPVYPNQHHGNNQQQLHFGVGGGGGMMGAGGTLSAATGAGASAMPGNQGQSTLMVTTSTKRTALESRFPSSLPNRTPLSKLCVRRARLGSEPNL